VSALLLVRVSDHCIMHDVYLGDAYLEEENVMMGFLGLLGLDGDDGLNMAQ